eukprot:7978272-Alexandrium_andersonii.AAC.1
MAIAGGRIWSGAAAGAGAAALRLTAGELLLPDGGHLKDAEVGLFAELRGAEAVEGPPKPQLRSSGGGGLGAQVL